MKPRSCRFLLALICLATVSVAVASSEIPPELIGTWDFASMTSLKDGKPFGTIHFKPGQWTLRLKNDGTYGEDFPVGKNPHMDGVYKVHGHNLQMKPAKGSADLRYEFSLEQDGKVLVLTDKGKSISTANRE
jgi:hypothetical protein